MALSYPSGDAVTNIAAIIDRHFNGQGEELIATGKIVRMGTFTASEEEVTGFVVACSREELEAIERNPLYRTVALRSAMSAQTQG